MSVTERIRKLWQLEVPAIALIAFVTSLMFSFGAIVVGGVACFLTSPLMGIVYVFIFGSALVAAVSRSRFLPQIRSIEFLAPILVSAVLIVAVGYGGLWTARFLNHNLLHLPEKQCGT